MVLDHWFKSWNFTSCHGFRQFFEGLWDISEVRGCHNKLKLLCAHLQVMSFILISNLGRYLVWLLRYLGSREGNLTFPLPAMCALYLGFSVICVAFLGPNTGLNINLVPVKI